ncbi:MAG: RNA polymerase sigma factor [Bacteroidetes bacterium]|nr:MAG: RNA polymerase sigma factor [Bacteroidota bacterium]
MDIDKRDIENQLFIDFRDNGNNNSFEELFRLVKPWLFKMIYRIVADYDDAKDIMQNAWIKLINSGDKYDPKKGNINNLIFTIAKNEALQWKRKDRIAEKNYQNYLGINANHMNNNNPEILHLFYEKSEAMRNAISKLNKDYQDVMLLYYYSDLSVNKIAVQLNIPEGTVKTWLDRGREKLKKYLKNYLGNN